MAYITDTIASYIGNFKAFEQSLNGESEQPLHTLCTAAIERFAGTGFPTTKIEDWKYTNVAPLARTTFKPAFAVPPVVITAEAIAGASFDDKGSYRLVFVNGEYASEHSNVDGLPDGVLVANLSEALQTSGSPAGSLLATYPESFENPFVSLNTAFIRNGAFVFVPDNVVLEKPIHILYVAASPDEATVNYPRTLISIGRNAAANVVEEYNAIGEDVYFTNAVTEIVVSENGRIDHCKIQEESEKAYHVGSLHVRLERSSNAICNSIAFGGALARNNATAVLAGEGAHCAFDGLYMAHGDQHIDNHTAIDHAMPNCTSHELYKGILDDNGRGVFNGKIIVRQDAQKTDSRQSNRNLLLSDTAEIDTKPELEIYADDVKCTHGATIGRLDEEGIFYLRARGIGEDEARAILTYAFAAEVLNLIKLDSAREHLEELLAARLAR